MSNLKNKFKWDGSEGKPSSTLIGSIFRGLMLFITVVVVVLMGIFYYVYESLQPAEVKSDEMLKVEIPMGSSVNKISSILKDKGLVRNKTIFYYYTRYKKEDNFQAGIYYLEQGMEIDSIIGQLKDGKIYADSVKVTIPEGLKISEIADLLAEKGLVEREEFLEITNTMEYPDISFMSEIPVEIEERENKLEGYLFPETYELRESATEVEIVEIMLEQLEKELKPEWLEEIENKGMTLNEVMALASIIEREVVVDSERKKVSGVYYNRLKKGMKLQADATVQYALGEHTNRVLYADLEIDNPYNTYKYKGLPPGPIAVPGRLSIEAAIFPDKHDYFYYVTKKDGSNEHYFAKTYAEHKNNIVKSKKDN